MARARAAGKERSQFSNRRESERRRNRLVAVASGTRGKRSRCRTSRSVGVERATDNQADPVAPADDVLRPFGVTVERIGGATIIDIPPVPSPRYLRRHLTWIAILFGV